MKPELSFKTFKTQTMADFFPRRSVGHKQTVDVLKWLEKVVRSSGFEVQSVPLKIKHWQPNSASAELLSPVKRKLDVLSMIESVGTDGKCITGEVLLFRNSTDLTDRRAEMKYEIVVLVTKLEKVVEFIIEKRDLATTIGRAGGLAVLTDHGVKMLSNNHLAQATRYEASIRKIPYFSLTYPDAMLVSRFTDRKQKMTMKLCSSAKTYTEKLNSRDLIFDLKGWKYPDEFIILEAHFDSVYNTPGFFDNALSVINIFLVLKALKDTGIRPKMTIRVMLADGYEVNYQRTHEYDQITITYCNKDEVFNGLP
ncbi:unnamed protein product [Sphagnum jensenii]|uniref:Carboxypeptidase Q n=1 Tax=Sphagnum jensenii TaxID=128206 RepID=A0ABP0VH25_9BRYO